MLVWNLSTKIYLIKAEVKNWQVDFEWIHINKYEYKTNSEFRIYINVPKPRERREGKYHTFSPWSPFSPVSSLRKQIKET